MIILEGKNLCERQKELNLKAKEAAQNQVPLQEVKCEGNPDVEMMFKIKLSSEYKDIDFVLEQLKSGDSLYVSKALKCEWIYDAEHAHIIHPDYLHHNIFPTMSWKMTKKTLSIISIYVRDETRAQLFFEYCNNTKMTNHASKFLIYTPESFKEKFLNNDHMLCEYKVNISNLIGNSFVLADIYGKRNGRMIDLRYLYSIDDQKYLDLFEKYTTTYIVTSIGVKLSRSLLKKHKERILRNPALYLSILKKSELIRYSSPQDAEIYLTALMPEDAKKYWNLNFCSKYEHILALVEPEKKYQLIKINFKEKYPTAEFEMSREFYIYKYHEMMSLKEREAWALNHLEKQVGVIDENESYKWYEYVNFEKAFVEIKKQISLASHVSTRSNMLNTLVTSAKTLEEVKKLLNYYRKRHINENSTRKETFVFEIIKHHKVFEFDDACWVVFDEILHSLEVYDCSNLWSFSNFVTVSLIYNIINEKTFPKGLYDKVGNVCIPYLNALSDALNDEKKDLVYNYMDRYIVNKITEFEKREYNEGVRNLICPYLMNYITLQKYHNKLNKVESYPDLVISFLKMDTKRFGYLFEEKPKVIDKPRNWEGYLMSLLKKDASLILEHLPEISMQCKNSTGFRINRVLKKISTYFLNDIGKQYTEYCIKWLYKLSPEDWGNTSLVKSMVFAIFQLGQESIKKDLMDKYAPTSPKIQYGKIDRYVLEIQEAICRFHCNSRPPVPVEKTALYLKGDYVHNCKDMFSMYRANLPPAMLTKFIELALNSPLSIQKRGLRLAFATFNSSNLKNRILHIWKKTKNVSLRRDIYISLANKVQEEKDKPQIELFELLKELTLTIHQDDDEDIFKFFTRSEVPYNLRGAYLQVAWFTVVALPENNRNIQRRTSVIEALTSNLTLIDEDFCMTLINNHVHKMLSEQKLRPETNPHIVELNKRTWDLVSSFIVHIPDETKLEKNLNIVKSIVQECFNNWNDYHDSGTFLFQSFFKDFVERLDKIDLYLFNNNSKTQRLVKIFKYLIETFENKFDISDMYSYYLDWKLALLTRTVIGARQHCDKEVHIDFGLQLGNLVKELKNKNRYYASFFQKIYGKASKCIRILKMLKAPDLTEPDVSVLVAYGLSLSEVFEGYVFALHMLPEDVSVRPLIEKELRHVIKKIKEQNSQELTTFMKDKFVYSSQKVMKIVL